MARHWETETILSLGTYSFMIRFIIRVNRFIGHSQWRLLQDVHGVGSQTGIQTIHLVLFYWYCAIVFQWSKKIDNVYIRVRGRIKGQQAGTQRTKLQLQFSRPKNMYQQWASWGSAQSINALCCNKLLTLKCRRCLLCSNTSCSRLFHWLRLCLLQQHLTVTQRRLVWKRCIIFISSLRGRWTMTANWLFGPRGRHKITTLVCCCLRICWLSSLIN